MLAYYTAKVKVEEMISVCVCPGTNVHMHTHLHIDMEYMEYYLVTRMLLFSLLYWLYYDLVTQMM